MNTITLTETQTKKFWNEVAVAVDWEVTALDKYLYDKYTIVKRRWITHRALKLTIEDEQYITWLRLYL